MVFSLIALPHKNKVDMWNSCTSVDLNTCEFEQYKLNLKQNKA